MRITEAVMVKSAHGLACGNDQKSLFRAENHVEIVKELWKNSNYTGLHDSDRLTLYLGRSKLGRNSDGEGETAPFRTSKRY